MFADFDYTVLNKTDNQQAVCGIAIIHVLLLANKETLITSFEERPLLKINSNSCNETELIFTTIEISGKYVEHYVSRFI